MFHRHVQMDFQVKARFKVKAMLSLFQLRIRKKYGVYSDIFTVCVDCLAIIGAILKVMISRIILRREEIKVDYEEDTDRDYKPVVIIHGILDPSYSLDFFSSIIRKNHPGTKVIVIHQFNGLFSLAPMWEQVDAFRKEVEDIAAKHPEGIHLVGISQGSVIGRGVLETSDKHNVHTFISLAGPQMGQYGFTQWNRIPGFTLLVKHLYRIFYSHLGQRFSVPDYWKDPFKLKLYKAHNCFLPVLNNEVEHLHMNDFKKNFLQIKHLVLIGGPDDGAITPWQSSMFGFYDEHGRVVEMREQEAYKSDTFGLRTLDERKAITVHTVPKVFHQYFTFNVKFIKQYIVPHLT